MSDQGDRLAWRGGEGNIPQHPGILATVAEPHAFEAHCTADWTRERDRLGWLDHGYRLVQQREDPLG